MDLPGILLALAALVTSVATLVTAVRTNRAVRTGNGQTIGQVVDSLAEGSTTSRAMAAAIGGRRAEDATPPTKGEGPDHEREPRPSG